MSNFEGKSVIVVGGSSGIGREIVRMVSESGGEVTVWSRNPPEGTGPEVRHVRVDTGEPLSIAPEDLPETVHGLVYCPGTIRLVPFQRLKEEDFLRDFNINVMGAVRTIQACIKPLSRAGGSSVVLVSTVASHVGMPYHASIATAKTALHGLALSLAAEYAPKSVRFNVVSPTLTDTPLAASLLSTPEKRSRSEQRHPLGRIGTAGDIAELAVFLLGGESAMLTGQIIAADGGMSALRLL
jgi:NAD(P)-dependent dehydrogenase (short-subunit alcohol dehydrogenase family)